jgi:hypothetical protein
MRYECIADIYSANEKFREMFIDTVTAITPAEAATLPDGEKWTIQQIAEHVSMVDSGVSRICSKLLEAAKGDEKPSDGTFTLSEAFGIHAAGIGTQKLEAPERVHPTGEVTLSEALERLQDSGAAKHAMRHDLEQLDFSAHTFPHPYFGPLNAGEWLVMLGLHENRHRTQIEGILAKVRQ